MALNIEFTNLMEVDLRDSGGHSMITAQITELSGTYDAGGVEITPEMFGLQEIQFMYIQSNVSVPVTEVGGEGDGWVCIITSALMNVDNEWRWTLHEGASLSGAEFNEFADNTPLQMPANYSPIVLVIGS
jgi:hypothetical protein